MIISNTNSYIFVAIPKTATHAIRFALRQHLDEKTDWEHVSKYITKRLPIHELSSIHHGHIRCVDIKPYLDTAIWNSYFKFAICRDPYDRFISSSSFLYRRDPAFSKDPVGTMKRIIRSDDEMKRILLRPQTEYICDNDGNLMVDYVGEYEQLEESYRKICDRTGVPYSNLESVNVTTRDSCKPQLDDELKALVRQRYLTDFELLDYSM